jgi:hypothetical protein
MIGPGSSEIHDKTITSRRSFIRSSALSIASFAAWNALPVAAMQFLKIKTNAFPSINPLFHHKLKILFVIGGSIHDSDTPGPCRSGSREYLTPEFEEQMHEYNFEQRKKQISAWTFPEEVELLEPVDFKMMVRKKNVHFEFPESEFTKVEKSKDEADLFIVLDGFAGDICVRLGQRFNKPVATISQSANSIYSHRTWGGWLVDMTAATRELDLESYLALDWSDLNRILSLLWIKKAFAHTKLLIFTDRFGEPPFGLESVLYDFTSLNDKYGMSYHHLSNQSLGNEIERITRNADEMAEVQKITRYMIDQATRNHMSENYLMNSMIAYKAVRNLMDQYGCNAFTIECREICPLELADQYKFTPCMIHSMLKDQGFPSVCQTDVNALLAMMALMYASKKSSYMGNPAFDVRNNLLTVLHDVPGSRMRGLAQDPLPFEIRNFTDEGWGATMRYDFGRDAGTVATLGRFNASGTRMFITRGKILRGFGMNQNGCSLGVDIQVRNARDIFEKLKDFGSHLAVVYGDYTEEMADLGDVLGFELISSV